ncbi:hypothetical protein BGZ96_004525 [Linnemannia gamsii]|uniref:Uncharacterized protein n=1 Tax=Linnemannia gamsii TaxID=64522 RepID=A0ABQ7K8D5_9FUNG|nr:hypothetical protein BGZ96_004525 [Linnemannia gamsii]
MAPMGSATRRAATGHHITTLNLLPIHQNVSAPHLPQHKIPLREILCAFEHLIHLGVPAAIYQIEGMELNTTQKQMLDD